MEQIRSKWKSLKTAYRCNKAALEKSGGAGTEFAWFEMLDELLRVRSLVTAVNLGINSIPTTINQPDEQEFAQDLLGNIQRESDERDMSVSNHSTPRTCNELERSLSASPTYDPVKSRKRARKDYNEAKMQQLFLENRREEREWMEKCKERAALSDGT